MNTNFKLETISTSKLEELMDRRLFEKTGVLFRFQMDVYSDGNLDLYSNRDEFESQDIQKLVSLGWLNDDADERYTCGDNIFEFSDTLCNPHDLFNFIIEETYGSGAKVVGVYEEDYYTNLTIGIPCE